MGNNWRIYLDYNATAPTKPEVRDAIQQAIQMPLNASSTHYEGRQAKAILESAREKLAGAINCKAGEVIFTASGTEANNTVLKTFTAHIISATEHASINQAAINAMAIPVDGNGLADISALEQILQNTPHDQEKLVSIILAHNETGVINPIHEIAKVCRRYNAFLHTDASQAIGRIPLDFKALDVDYMTISAHKFGGGHGAAALIVRDGAPLQPLMHGGGQELGVRSGTHNLPALAGMAAALENLEGDLYKMRELKVWRDQMEADIMTIAPDAVIVGGDMPRLPNTSLILMPGVSSEIQLMNLDLGGIAVSNGSACSSGRVEVSASLLAMGFSETQAATAIRISTGWATNWHDIEAFIQQWRGLYQRLSLRAKATKHAA